MESIEAITSEISEFPGAVILVTHDENMLRSLATKLVVFKKSGADLYNGTYDEFLQEIGWQEEDNQ